MSEKFKEDPAETSINTRALDKEFQVNENDNQLQTKSHEELLLEITQMRQALNEASDDVLDPDTMLKHNIDRANRILDICEEEMSRGNYANRTVEVAGQLINAVTSAVSQIMGDGYKQEEIRQKDEALKLKEREIELKRTIKQAKEGGEGDSITNNNIIVTDRETIMDMIKNPNKTIENNS